ncbi:MAG: hypothetical protein H0V41_05105 [Pseudonocardiales bacterium]|nr:hypothetical protein [Pseudonocardiales bacterium]
MKPEQTPHAQPACPLLAVVVNPVSVGDVAKLQTQITRVCLELGWRAPLWLQTTVEDPGGGQGRGCPGRGR